MTDELSITLPVQFHLNEDKLQEIINRAVELDDQENGEHMREYTIEQAITVVFHQDPEFLFNTGRLWGWTVEKHDLWPENIQWVPGGAPEGHMIEEEPV